ncbi:MAG: adenosylcobinamide-GDP ribazoletransferase [Dongiaceae bacterium]
MDDETQDRDSGWPPDLGGWWADLKIASAFLTRLPIPPVETTGLPALARAARCFPLVGLGVGLAGGVVYALAVELGLPPLPAAVLAVAATVLATGALHEDGLADTVDGFGGGNGRDDKLRIMRDSRIGTYGVMSLILILGMQVAALAALADSGDVAATLMVGHAVSRALLVPVMHLEAPARGDGLAASVGRPPAPTVLWALGIGGLIAVVLAGLGGLLAAAIAAAVAWGTAGLARRQIGGITGDVLGAAQQGAMTATLLVLVALD